MVEKLTTLGMLGLVPAGFGFLSGNYLLLAAGIGFSGFCFGVAFLMRKRQFWSGQTPHSRALVHLDARMAVRPTILGHTPPDGYRLACLYFGTGLLDRTRRLNHGFTYDIIDRIPRVPNWADAKASPSFADLCARRANEIVKRARRENAPIHLLWSGGIDSTVACLSIMQALGDDIGRLVIFETKASRAEYPLFSKKMIPKR